MVRYEALRVERTVSGVGMITSAGTTSCLYSSGQKFARIDVIRKARKSPGTLAESRIWRYGLVEEGSLSRHTEELTTKARAFAVQVLFPRGFPVHTTR